MKIVFEFVDKDKKPLNLTKEEKDKIIEERIDCAMSRIGFKRVYKAQETEVQINGSNPELKERGRKKYETD